MSTNALGDPINVFFLFLFKMISFQFFLNYSKKIILKKKIKKKNNQSTN